MKTISYKVKVRPEDFQVVEAADLQPSERGEYRLYRLTKANWNTTDLLLRLATRFGLPYDAFSYGGKKDRHALTTQYITIKDQKDLSLVELSYSLQSLGFVSEPMGPEFIRGNEFRITLRALKEGEIHHLERNLQAVIAFGLPNYFDDQRFGSYDKERGFIAEKLLKDRWEEALKIYLTLQYPQEKKAAKERKRHFLEHWWKWDQCLEQARTATERKVFGFLLKRGGDYVAAVNLLPREELSLILAAYQSFLWNEMVAEMIRHLASAIIEVPGYVKGYVFYTHLERDAFEYLRSLRLPMPGPQAILPDEYAGYVYKTTLERAGLSEQAFAMKRLVAAYFRSFLRDVLLRPEGLELLDLSRDELYPGLMKAVVKFFLPRGSYGTMVLERLTLRV